MFQLTVGSLQLVFPLNASDIFIGYTESSIFKNGCALEGSCTLFQF